MDDRTSCSQFSRRRRRSPERPTFAAVVVAAAGAGLLSRGRRVGIENPTSGGSVLGRVLLGIVAVALVPAGCLTEFDEGRLGDQCDPPCGRGQACVDGVCVSVGADADADAEAAADADVEADADPFCGDEKESRATLSNIVAGQPTFDPSVVELNDGQVLAVGAMLKRDPLTGSFLSVCTATLVTDTVVLLAAQCVIGWTGVVRPADVRFSVGRDVADPEHVFEVSEVHYNTAYRLWGAEQARADEGVLVLAESAAEAIPGIRPIPINREPLPDGFLGARVQTVGFGSTEPGGGEGNTVRWWTTEEVTDVTDYDFTLYGGGVSSVCSGDFGGPALLTFPDGGIRVVGTASWGDDSCVDYDHFTRTDHNLDFLYPYVGDEPVDPCGGLTWEGRCEAGEFAVWCIDGVSYRRDCAACDQTCGDAGPSLGYYCL